MMKQLISQRKKIKPRVKEVNKNGQKATRWWGWTGRSGATLVESNKFVSFMDNNNNNNNYNNYTSVISNLNIDGDYVEKYINYNEFNDCCCGGYAVAVCMGEYKFNLIAPKNKQCYNNLCHLVSSINSNFIGFNLLSNSLYNGLSFNDILNWKGVYLVDIHA